MEAVIHPLDAGPYWVGFEPKAFPDQYFSTATGPEPGWTPTCAGCFLHVPPDAGGLPGPSDASCVQGVPPLNVPWQATPCVSQSPLDVICEREPLGHAWTPCDAGYCFDVPFTLGYKHYVFVGAPTDPTTAAQQCAALGGLLVVFQWRDEREQIWRELVTLPPEARPVSIWIGLSLADGGAPTDPNAWVWADDAGPDAYPPEWGINGGFQPEPSGMLPNAVAYGPQLATDPVDETLVANDLGGPHPFVCQVSALPQYSK
jgi:hypothetical protein